jgi:hypothetical protein
MFGLCHKRKLRTLPADNVSYTCKGGNVEPTMALRAIPLSPILITYNASLFPTPLLLSLVYQAGWRSVLVLTFFDFDVNWTSCHVVPLCSTNIGPIVFISVSNGHTHDRECADPLFRPFSVRSQCWIRREACREYERVGEEMRFSDT